MSIRGSHNNRKDGNQTEIVHALRKQGAHVHIFDDPCDLLVKYEGIVYFLDVKALDGHPTGDQLKFNDKMRDSDGTDTIAFVRTIDEALYAIGAKLAPYDYKAEIHDQTVIVKFYVSPTPRRSISAALEGLANIQGVRNISGLDAFDELMVWPKKNIKIEALHKRIDHFLDFNRIGAPING